MAAVLASLCRNVSFHGRLAHPRIVFCDKFSNYRSLSSYSTNVTNRWNFKRSETRDRSTGNSGVAAGPLSMPDPTQFHGSWTPTSVGSPRYFSTASRAAVDKPGLFIGHLNDSRFCIMHSQRRMAGHNKWSNIKHIKGAKDTARSLLFQKIVRQMKLSMQGGKSNDPRFNIALAHAVDAAKQANMPIAKIDAVLKATVTSKETMIPFTLSMRGPGGCFIIIETLSDNVNRTKSNIKYAMSKLGTTAVDGGVQHAFDFKGTINVDAGTSKLNLEKAVELAIEIGAEDVVETSEDDDLQVFQFQCDPKEFFAVKTQLATRGFDLKSSGLNYIPKIKAQLSDDQLDVMSRLYEVLNEHPDVVKIYENVE